MLITWNGWENLTKMGFTTSLHPCNYLRERVSSKSYFNPLSANTKKMTKHTQTIRWKLSTNFLSVFDRFVGLGYKELK